MTFPHSRIRTPRVKKSLDEEYEISQITCEIHYASYEPLLLEMCMCNQSKTIHFSRAKTLSRTIIKINPQTHFQVLIFFISESIERRQQSK